MACVHLQKLYQLCQDHEMRILVSGSDLVRIVCRECGAQDVCPSSLREGESSEEEERTADPEDA